MGRKLFDKAQILFICIKRDYLITTFILDSRFKKIWHALIYNIHNTFLSPKSRFISFLALSDAYATLQDQGSKFWVIFMGFYSAAN